MTDVAIRRFSLQYQREHPRRVHLFRLTPADNLGCETCENAPSVCARFRPGSVCSRDGVMLVRDAPGTIDLTQAHSKSEQKTMFV